MPDITDALAELRENARSQLEALDAELETVERRARELRKARTQIRNFVGERPKTKPKTNTHGTAVGEEVVDALYDYLRRNYNGAEFTTADLLKDPRYDVPLLSTTTRLGIAMNRMHERGQARLVRATGGGANHQGKIWKVTDGR